MKKNHLSALLAGVSFVLLAMPAVASAQDVGDASSLAVEEGQGAPIVVTGSRIVRDGADAPTPVTVIGSDRLKELGITNVGEALNQIPAFRPTVTPSTNGLNAASAGARIADLRGLGPLRTLVLVDGRRFTPSTAQGTVDLNMIPSALIDRAEVVTGGASAAYGSDAVAGVINLILDNDLNGIRASAQYGQSDHEDNRDYLVSLAGGTDLFGGNGHLVVGGEYNENDGVGDCMTRAWCQPHYGTIFNPTPGVGGLPALIMIDNANASGLTPGGLITAPGPLAGLQFGPDGEAIGGYQFGDFYSPSGVFMQGGTGEGDRDAYLSGYLLKLPVTRYNAYAHFDVDLAPAVNLYTALSYGQVRGSALSAQTRDKTLKISVDNPFLPEALHQTMIDEDIASFTFGRSGLDLGRAQIQTRTRTFNGVFGLRGELGGGWKWDAYYQYGRTRYLQLTSNDRITANFARALDAVSGPGGGVVCRSTLTDPTDGCVPLNLFGENNFSAAAKAYAFGTARQDATFTQNVGSANISGSPFDSWAGPVRIAAGAEYRVDESNSVADPISRNLGFYVSNAQDIAGRQKVTEGYLEAVVPLLDSDALFARSLELNGAIRRTHYAVSGAGTSNSFNATTWKLGLVYEPVSALRLRATRSRDIRAPNISELYGARTQTFAVTADPLTSSSVFLPVPQPSNPFLTPEIADTLTLGAAFTPEGGVLSGLRLSVDFYEVKIDNAIARPGSQTVVNRCLAGATEFCDFVVRNSGGGLASVTNPLLNLSSQTVRGIDFDLGYRIPVSHGAINLRVLATRVLDLVTSDSVGSIDRAGQTGFPVGGVPGLPDWVVDSTVNYRGGPLSLTAQARFVSAGYNDVTRIGPDDSRYDPSLPNSTNINRLPSRVYFNLAGSYDLMELGERGKVELFGAVENLFDRDPPGIHNDQIATNGILFDTIGRNYRMGLRIEY